MKSTVFSPNDANEKTFFPPSYGLLLGIEDICIFFSFIFSSSLFAFYFIVARSSLHSCPGLSKTFLTVSVPLFYRHKLALFPDNLTKYSSPLSESPLFGRGSHERSLCYCPYADCYGEGSAGRRVPQRHPASDRKPIWSICGLLPSQIAVLLKTINVHLS